MTNLTLIMNNTLTCRRISGEIDDFGSAPPKVYAGTDSRPFRQAWLDGGDVFPREGGLAWAGYDDTHVRFYALLDDSDIFTRASADNQWIWTLGDTAEFFVKPGKSQDFYTEIHLSSNGYLMDLGISSREKFFKKLLNMEDVINFNSGSARRVETFPGEKRWAVELRTPWRAYGLDAAPAPGTVWQLAVCRYNYGSHGAKPELSSTAFLKECNFHRYEEYLDLVFE